jgi:hypothetical protein
MKIRNTTTGQIDELIYAREPHNTGNLVDDPAIVYNKATDEHEANQETIDWWTEYLKNESDYQDLYAEVRAGLDPLDQEEFDLGLIAEIGGCDYGDAPVAGAAYLRKFINKASQRRFAIISAEGNPMGFGSTEEQAIQDAAAALDTTTENIEELLGLPEGPEAFSWADEDWFTAWLEINPSETFKARYA